MPSNLKRAIISSSDGIVNEPGYDVSLVTTLDLNASTSVPYQATQQGDVLLWAGFTKGIGFGNWNAMVDACAPFPNIKYAYVYDEVFLGPNGTIVMGLDEPAIHTAALYAKSKGLKPVITILPDIILDPAFVLNDINAYDVISVDVYPQARLTSTIGNYPQQYPNVLSNLLFSSLQRLRQLGFTGEVWYLYQAFGIQGNSEAANVAAFNQQIETLNACEAMGIQGIAAFGFWLGAAEIAAEPHLFQGYGTIYESQLRYPPFVPTPIVNTSFSLTTAGILAASNATPTGPAIKIVAFKLGDNATQAPLPVDTDLIGNQVYAGVPASFSFYDEQTIQINMEVPADVGPFQYGELGLYLDNDVLFCRFSYGLMQIKTAAPTGSVANVLRINALLRIAQGGSSFNILPGTAQTVIELSSFSLVNTPMYYPENPVVLVHEPNDFQESTLLHRTEQTLWNMSNYSRIGTATITAADDVFHLTADYFGTLYLPPNNLGRFILQAPGGFIRTITGFNLKVATLAQQMDTAALVGQAVAVYELDTAAFADLYASVIQLQATTQNANLYLGLTTFTPGAIFPAGPGGIPPAHQGPSIYKAAPSLAVVPDVFALTFDTQSTSGGMTLLVGVPSGNPELPLLDANGNPMTLGLISANETRTVIRANGKYYVQDVPNAGAVTSVAGKTGVVTLVSSDVGLGNVNNTSDINKPVSTATANQIAAGMGTATSNAQATSLQKSGGTMSGTINMAGNSIDSPLLKGTREFRDAPVISGLSLSLDMTTAVSAVALNANITSVTFTNNNASAVASMSKTLEFTADGTQRSAIWPNGNGVSTLLVKWSSGTAPTFTATAGKRDRIALTSVSQFLWDGFVIGQNL